VTARRAVGCSTNHHDHLLHDRAVCDGFMAHIGVEFAEPNHRIVLSRQRHRLINEPERVAPKVSGPGRDAGVDERDGLENR